MRERILNFFGWRHFRAWRHANHDHRLCRRKTVNVEVGRLPNPQLLTYINDGGKEERVEVSTFGGWPIYRTEVRHW